MIAYTNMDNFDTQISIIWIGLLLQSFTKVNPWKEYQMWIIPWNKNFKKICCFASHFQLLYFTYLPLIIFLFSTFQKNCHLSEREKNKIWITQWKKEDTFNHIPPVKKSKEMRNIRNYNSKKILVTPLISKYEVESNVSHASPNLSIVDSFSHRGEHQQSKQESVREFHFHKNFRLRKVDNEEGKTYSGQQLCYFRIIKK